MTEEDVLQIANTYLAEQWPNPRLAGEPCRFECVSIWPPDESSYWSVVYDIMITEDPTAVVDGPVIIMVHAITKQAYSMKELADPENYKKRLERLERLQRLL